MHRAKILLLLLLLPSLTFAQTPPDWVVNKGTSNDYPSDTYLTGFGQGTDADQATCLQGTWEQARSELSQSVRVTIQDRRKLKIEETEETYASHFIRVTSASSRLDVQGLEKKEYYDRAGRACYVLAYVERAKLLRAYGQRVTRLKSEIQSHLLSASRHEGAGERTKALNEYTACDTLLFQLDEARLVMIGAQREGSSRPLDAELAQDIIMRNQVEEATRRLAERPVNTLDDLAWILAYTMKQEVDASNLAVLVRPFLYQDTEMGSPFASYFRRELEARLFEVAQWNPIPAPNSAEVPKSTNIVLDLAQAAGATHVLTGSYWPRGDGVKFISTLQHVAKGPVASANVLVPRAVLESTGYSLEPANVEQALHDVDVVLTDEVVESKGLRLEAWTNRQAAGNLFREDDIMQVYVRVNQPVYIRFIYRLADGTSTLLMDSEYIDNSKVNKPFLIPQRFQCTPPFGAETLLIFASTEKFAPLDTVNVDGYDILREDLKTYLGKMRGFQREKIQAEKRITITTMAR